MEVVNVRQPLDGQAVLVRFALDVHFHQMLEKLFSAATVTATSAVPAV
jgi:hypothetical protein